MRRNVFLALWIAIATVPIVTAQEQPVADKPAAAGPAAATGEYKLVWADEFNVDGRPDPKNWTYEEGFVRNEEHQLYRPENARCEGGMLIIEARREKVANPRYQEGARGWQRSRQFAEYTSACILTRRLQQWQYGRFEMHGRIDIRAGLWPAWWTLGYARGWPGGGEIDIMEYYKGDILANVAWQGQRRGQTRWDAFKKPVRELGDAEWAKKFHTWRMDWTPESIKLFVDDQLLNETDLKETVNGDAEAANPFHEPHYMLLNLAVGGRNGGDPSPTEFPAKLEVDWVRVYQKTEK